jgi:integrase
MHSHHTSTTTSTTKTRRSLPRTGPRLKIIQVQLGHEHASTTSIYTLAAPDYRARELERVLTATLARSNARLDGPTPKES